MPGETLLKVWLGRKDCTKFLLAGRWSAQTMWWSFVFSKCTRNLLQTFIEVTFHLQLVFFFQFVKPLAATMGLFWVMTLVYWLTISTIVVKYFLIYSFKKRDLSLEELLILTVTSFRPGSSRDAVICRYPNSTDTARSLFPPTMPSNSNMRLHACQIPSGCSNNRGHLEAITFFHFPDKSVPN